LRIGFVSFGDPRRRGTWSGTTHSAFARLSQAHEVEWLDSGGANLTLLRQIHKVVGALTRRPLRSYHTEAFARGLARNLRKYDLDKYDLLFSIGSSDIAFLRTETPIVHMTDATFAQMVGYYDGFDMGTKRNAAADAIQRAAYDNSAQLVLMSQWAAASARNDYGVPEHKINVLRFGANLEVPSSLPPKREDGKLRLLFVGKEWQRKGGTIAVDALNALRRRGIDATLTMVGCLVPPELVRTPGLQIIPYVEDVTPYFRESDAFILPTRAECAGIVFCEASAYGLPCFATWTGGVPDYVEDGVNGFLLPPSAGGEDFAARIAETFADPDVVEKLRQGARRKYERELNWDAWMEGFEQAAEKALSR